ncbi:MAG: hypothetical protein KIT58_25005, partial [Planctomycetota bacterium]|nr:hypothetical protein [Planctomycetota bacterium]
MSVTRDNDPVAYTLRLAVCVTAALAVHLLAVFSSSQEEEAKAEQQRIAVVLKETMTKVKEEMEKLLQEAQQE